MRILALITAACLCTPLLLESAETTAEGALQRTADELDSLASQKEGSHERIQRPGFPPQQIKTDPLDLKRITPLVAARLKVSENAVRDLLQNDREKLSELVMACELAKTTGQTWEELANNHSPAELIRMVEERKLAPKVKPVLDELYTELSFALLDQMENAKATGKPPGGEKGSAKSK
jgi:hypothetical protein